MTWQGITGQDDIALQFAKANERRRLGGSFLFVGPQGIGKRSFAFALAKTLLCQNQNKFSNNSSNLLDSFVPCNLCESCRCFDISSESKIPLTISSLKRSKISLSSQKKAAKTEQVKQNNATETSFGDKNKVVVPLHPDFFYVCKPDDKSLLPLELLIGEKENRLQSGLCYNISKTPYLGKRKIAVIDDADYLNNEGANALLKTIEEPPFDSIIILIGTSSAKQLPTIRSRCQTIRFHSLDEKNLASLLLEKKYVSDLEQGLCLAQESDGSIVRAIELTDATLDSFRLELYQSLLRLPFNSVEFAIRLNDFVDSAGKEAILRRNRLRMILTMGLEFYRNLLYSFEEQFLTSLPDKLQPFYRQARSKTTDIMTIVRMSDETIKALEQTDRNVNLPYVIDLWLNNLSHLN